MGIYTPIQRGPREIDGLLVPPGIAYKLLKASMHIRISHIVLVEWLFLKQVLDVIPYFG